MKFKIYTIAIIMSLSVIMFSTSSFIEVSAQEGDDFKEIEKYLETEMINSILPGMAVGIVKNGHIVYTKAFGKADEIGTPMTVSSPNLLASVSKAFTALAVMQLNESGKIQLDAKVIDYVPWFRMANKSASDQITVRYLLHQLSGITTETGIKYIAHDQPQSKEEFIQGIMMDSLHCTPGTKYDYSNANFILLGLIIEMVTGKSFEDYVQINILNKLNMTNSYLLTTGESTIRNVQWYRLFYGLQIPINDIKNPVYNPAGGVVSTAYDMCKYMIAQLNYGKYGSNSILSPEGMVKLHSLTENFDGQTKYAMGWVNTTLNGVPVLTHSGGDIGAATQIFLAPDDGKGNSWGVFVMMNSYNFVTSLLTQYRIAENTMNMLLEKPTLHVISPVLVYIVLDIIIIIITASVIRDLIKLKKKGVNFFPKCDSRRKKISMAVYKTTDDILVGILILLLVPPLAGIFTGYGPTSIDMVMWIVPDLMFWGALMGFLLLVSGSYKILLAYQFLTSENTEES